MLRTLGLFSAAAIVIGSMVGSGIFLVTPEAARLMETPALLIGLWVLTGIITVLGATSYGKLAAFMPEAGGQYTFLRKSWGDVPAFLYGWVFFWVVQTGFLAAVAVAFARHVGILWPAINTTAIASLPFGIPLTTEKLLAIVTLLGLTWINTRGVEAGAAIQNIFTSLKVVALFAIIIIGFAFGSNLPTLDWSLAIPDTMTDVGILSVLSVAAVGPLFSSDSWNYVTFIGGEVKNPSQTLPKALILGASLVVGLYVLVNLAYLNVLPMAAIQTVPDDKVAALMMSSLFGNGGGMIIALIILVSTFGCLNGMVLGGARVFYAMAQDGLLFKQFGQLDPVTKTPNLSLWTQFVWAVVLAMSGSYGTLLNYIIFTTLVFYIVTMLGLYRLAKHNAKAVQMTRWWDNIPPGLYIALASVLAWYLLISPTTQFTSLAGAGLTLTGLPVYFIWKKLAQ
jgi:APA family basic amino acid/polyamine antiporter